MEHTGEEHCEPHAAGFDSVRDIIPCSMEYVSQRYEHQAARIHQIPVDGIAREPSSWHNPNVLGISEAFRDSNKTPSGTTKRARPTPVVK